MKHARALLFIIMTAAFCCYAGTVFLPRDCWQALQKVSSFHELNSETNIPPEIISDCASQFPHRRLLWAVTDGKYYVMHHEYIYDSGVSFSTNYSIYIDTTNHDRASAGYTYSFKDYKTFVQSCHGFLGSGF
jgi:hypothetical protein